MNAVFAKRRNILADKLGETGVLVLAATPELIVGRDTELRYVVDSELYYLTGYTEPEAVLVLSPANAEAPFTMFVRPRDPARELWSGRRGGIEAARERFGADAVHPISELSLALPPLLSTADVLYARLGAGRPELDGILQRILADARHKRPRTGRSPHSITDPGELLDPLRVIKDDSELALIREAARITSQAFIEMLPRIRDGVGEWEIEAGIEYGFRSRGADGAAFPTIAAAGANAAVLHYIENSAVAHAGGLFLLDAGARYRMYCGDITRTVPVSGEFTAEQRDLYDIVLAAHAAAIAETRPGAYADAAHHAVQRVLADGLIQLGLLNGTIESAIEAEDGLRRYYPHRTSHWLGLDVHDVGAYAIRAGPVELVPNMVLTIEPALYIAGRNIGIRIEDDVVVTSKGCEVLTGAVPK
ncbi:MAG: aminopeptidase P N-terminal domain-containing protein [Gemmatimonadota bacterium]